MIELSRRNLFWDLIRKVMAEKRPNINWLDVLWLLFLLGLALIPPVKEIHKQLLYLAFGVTQLLEGWVIAQVPKRGAAYIVLIKIGLSALLINHTGRTADQQQLLADLLFAHRDCGRVFQSLGDTDLDHVGFSYLLGVSFRPRGSAI